MQSFEANPMKGTSFDIDDENEIDLSFRIGGDGNRRSLDEIFDMIEQITQRLKFYENLYKRAKRNNNRNDMILALRNYKALEGARQGLRWSINDPDAEIVLY